jgi:hypothetical protein
VNEIRRIAKIYFDEFEGLHLYTSPRTRLFYVWVIALIAMMAINVGFVVLLGSNQIPEWFFAFPLASDVLAAHISQRLTKQRDSRIKEVMKLRDGFDFDSFDACKKSRLSGLLGIRPEKILETADDICHMQVILARHDPTSRESPLQFIVRYVYDSRSKDRILNLGLVFVGVVVTLAATSQANLENLFDAYSSDSFLRLMTLMETLAVAAVMVWGWLFAMWLSLRHVFNQWWAKLFAESRGGQTEISYMVCDLVLLHRRPPLPFPSTS